MKWRRLTCSDEVETKYDIDEAVSQDHVDDRLGDWEGEGGLSND